MRGYFAFLIVFAAFALLISLAELNLSSKSHNLSAAITAEKFYRTQMNVKEVLIEAARQGAAGGFDAYAATHNEAACLAGDAAHCFSSRDAENAAGLAAIAKMQLVIAGADFDGVDVEVQFGADSAQAHVEPDSASPSGWRLSGVDLSSISIKAASENNAAVGVTVDMPRIKVDADAGASYP
ncbi:hypothetical protein H0O02_03085 [Candidatus Micrarchaeota archaeon]|nr:hypothetical protein [Candidatus Micrarchaeota archaeon]